MTESKRTRNGRIVERRIAGWTLRDIGLAFGMSTQRVAQIVSDEKRRLLRAGDTGKAAALEMIVPRRNAERAAMRAEMAASCAELARLRFRQRGAAGGPEQRRAVRRGSRWTPARARSALRRWFRRSGYARSGPERGTGTHRGYELRFVADDAAEAESLMGALAALGIEAGSPFLKARRFCVPVYGAEAVARLWALLRP